MVCEFLVEARGILFLEQRVNPGPLHGGHEVLATRPRGKSLGKTSCR